MPNLIATSVSVGISDTLQMSVNEPSDFQPGVVTEVPDLEDIPLAVLLQQKNLKEAKATKMVVDLCKLSHEGRPNSVRRCVSGDGVWVFTGEMLQKVP